MPHRTVTVFKFGKSELPLRGRPCSRPGEDRDPNAWNNSGRASDLGNSAVPERVGRLGGKGFWLRDYGGGKAALLAHADLAP